MCWGIISRENHVIYRELESTCTSGLTSWIQKISSKTASKNEKENTKQALNGNNWATPLLQLPNISESDFRSSSQSWVWSKPEVFFRQPFQPCFGAVVHPVELFVGFSFGHKIVSFCTQWAMNLSTFTPMAATASFIFILESNSIIISCIVLCKSLAS